MSTELKIRVWQSCLPSEGAREGPASLLFPASGGHPWSLAHDPHLPSSSQQGLAGSLVVLPSPWFSLLSLPFLLLKTLLIMLCPPGQCRRISPSRGQPIINLNFIYNLNSSLPHNIMYSQDLGTRLRIPLGAFFYKVEGAQGHCQKQAWSGAGLLAATPTEQPPPGHW